MTESTGAGPTTSRRVRFWDGERLAGQTQALIGEEPLSIRIGGKPYSVVMRTPGDEIAHVAGFCLGEGIADAPEDLASVAFCDGADTNVVAVTLTSARRERVADHLDRRNYISQTSCGLCGKEMVDELRTVLRPVTADIRVPLDAARGLLETLADLQPLRRETRAVHAAAIHDRDLALLSVAEDVGRHNALDKAVGRLFLDGRLDEAAVLVLSSRISYELVQKAARARIPMILAVSRPTALAVELAEGLRMTLACLARGAGMLIFCEPDRLTTGETTC